MTPEPQGEKVDVEAAKRTAQIVNGKYTQSIGHYPGKEKQANLARAFLALQAELEAAQKAGFEATWALSQELEAALEREKGLREALEKIAYPRNHPDFQRSTLSFAGWAGSVAAQAITAASPEPPDREEQG